MTWLDKALCSKDKDSHKWLSFDYSDIEYARAVCNKCTVKVECLMTSEDRMMVGMIAGLSEFERMILKWKEAKELNESNWQ